jgi:hypothetical protein
MNKSIVVVNDDISTIYFQKFYFSLRTKKTFYEPHIIIN